MRRSAVVIAIVILVVGLGVAIWLPRYTCREPYELVPSSGPGAPSGGWSCMHTDMGYTPDGRLALKWGIAILTVVGAGVVLTAGRTRDSR